MCYEGSNNKYGAARLGYLTCFLIIYCVCVCVCVCYMCKSFLILLSKQLNWTVKSSDIIVLYITMVYTSLMTQFHLVTVNTKLNYRPDRVYTIRESQWP